MEKGFETLRCEYGAIEGMAGFYYWFIGGEAFESNAGEFEGPFDTLEIAKAKAEEATKGEGLEIRLAKA